MKSKDWLEQKTASNQQTLRVVSEEQETSVLSPTTTASLTCKNKITLTYSAVARVIDCAGFLTGYNLNANETGFWTLGEKVKVE